MSRLVDDGIGSNEGLERGIDKARMNSNIEGSFRGECIVGLNSAAKPWSLRKH